MKDDTPDTPDIPSIAPTDEVQLGGGFPMLNLFGEEAPQPDKEAEIHRLIHVEMPVYPGKEGPAPVIEVIVKSGGNPSIHAKVIGKISCVEEYTAVMALISQMV